MTTRALTNQSAARPARVRATRARTVRTRRTREQIAKAKARSATTHARHILVTYGITADEYQRMHRFQGGRCALCRRATGATRRLAVDHCHATGRVRGLLCKRCNTILGHARDDVDFFWRCSEYLINPPAFAVIGERVVPDGGAVLAGPDGDTASDGGM